MTNEAYTTPTSTVAALPDQVLLAQTRSLARHEQALQILVLDHLREIEARALHLRRGYSSLFDYAVRELGYSDGAAWRRIKAMRLCSDTPLARERLEDGSLSMSAAAQLQNTFERLDRTATRGGRTTDHTTPAALPSGAAPAVPAEAQPPVLPLNGAAREELVERATGKSTREVKQMLASVDPESAVPDDRVRALGCGRWELKVVIDTECQRGLEQLKNLLSHVDPHLTVGQLVGRLVRDGLDRYDPARPRRGRGKGQRAKGEAAPPGAPAPLKRAARVPEGGTSPAKSSPGDKPKTATSTGRSAQPADSAVTPAARTTSHGSGSASQGKSCPRHTDKATSPAKSSGDSAPRVTASANSSVTRPNVTTSRAYVAPSTTQPSGEKATNDTAVTMSEEDPEPAALATAEPNPQTTDDSIDCSAVRSRGRSAPSAAKPFPADARGGAVAGERTATARSRRRTRRPIPVRVKREVWQRDGGSCSYVDPHSGRRCGSRFLLEIDHVVPYALGGADEPGNLRLYCEAHHRYRHAGHAAEPADAASGKSALFDGFDGFDGREGSRRGRRSPGRDWSMAQW